MKNVDLMMDNHSLTARMLVITLFSTVTLAIVQLAVMTYFMDTLANTILLNTLRPVAKAAAQSAESHIHMMADRFFMMRDDIALSAPHYSMGYISMFNMLAGHSSLPVVNCPSVS